MNFRITDDGNERDIHEIHEMLTPDDIQRDIIDRAGAELKAFEHVNDCLAVRKKLLSVDDEIRDGRWK